ncbi:MAG: methyltransferase domain-containing protein, partial [Planctomycetota bacterium]
MSRRTRFCVTLDVERDYAPEWRTPPTLTFTSVERALPELFAPLCREHGVRPTYLLSPETLCSRSATASLRALQQQKDCELGAHLHAEYVPPGPRPQQWCDHDVRIAQMQRDLDPDDERARLATLTELFVQQIGERPRAFRSGRFGASQHTGRFLRELGYAVDSSVTPLVVWKASDGTAAPDYRAMRHLPYRVHDDGDLCRHGHGPLLEIPVTVVAPSELGRIGNEPVWLRPWSSDRATMHAVLDAAARAEDEGKPWRTLCMMFHSMELVAGASPYPQTEADVARYLDDLRAVFSRARELGFAMQTLTEAALDLAREDDSTVRNAAVVVDASAWTAPDPKWQVFGSAFDPEPALVAHGAQPWFLYSCKQRHERWDNCLGYEWLAQNVRKDAPVLDLGCGPGFNLQWLARTGHTNLFGCDLDNKAIAAGSDIARATNTELHLWVDDAITSRAAPARRFAAIAAMNWIQLVPEFDLDAFLRRAKTLLTDDGALLLDYVDERYGEHAKSRWLTSDWNKPENERRASEYRTRFSPAILVDALRRHGFAVEQHWRIDGPVPRGVIASRRRPARKKQVLWVVDAPGWAHDRKAENLCRVLADRYDGRIVYQDALVESDLERADLVVLFYWRQLQSLDRLKPAFARLRHKLLLGICSHNELEGEFLNPGLALLRRLPRAVFTHSELLEREFRPRVGGPGY